MPFTIESARSIFPTTQVANVVPNTVESFNQLSAEDQLALIWFAYTEMGTNITVAAPGATNMIIAQGILEQIKQMPPMAQTQVMCDLANRADTPICRSYASFSVNLKLGFWNQLGEWMEQGAVAPIPQGYELSAEAANVLQAIRAADSGQQITILRNAVIGMGFDPDAPGSYKKLEDPVVVPTEMANRTSVTIEGVNNDTVLSYINNMNANDFEAAIDLFTSNGALQPPFQRPIVGREAILSYMRAECQGLKMMPEQGVVEPSDEGFTPIKVTGKVQTPWFGASVGMNIAWRFLLDPQGKIFFVAVDLLASPKELLNLVRQ
ncbi:Red carotenoid-binding protein [Oculatella sp. LEGE 06141]|uniref:orange carotenoid protein N-terminal domain-containing protein n=1 Tax=Oculatella sp. LEGE 06141 TaxID=1828648 RepID=UPI00187E4DD9|nr:orange carotenoid protein N-terminal domain-containing protein [Oculatella sp. LEGE 06141]MBE9182159.1 Red carotenoid-binding protein [Oculatella sp. LEGE 06141]